MKRLLPSPTLHCPLCGFGFAKRDAECHTGCPMGKACNLLRCPSCLFEFPEPPSAPGWLRRLFSRPGPATPGPDVLSLPDVEEGETTELVSLRCAHASRQNALAVYGLVPGCQVELQQKKPAYVIRVGETELALDAEIAREICVRRMADAPRSSSTGV